MKGRAEGVARWGLPVFVCASLALWLILAHLVLPEALVRAYRGDGFSWLTSRMSGRSEVPLDAYLATFRADALRVSLMLALFLVITLGWGWRGLSATRPWLEPAPLRDLGIARVAIVGLQLALLLWPGVHASSLGADPGYQAFFAGTPGDAYAPNVALRLVLPGVGRPDASLLVNIWGLGVVAAVLGLLGLGGRIPLLILAWASTVLVAHNYSYHEYHHPEALHAIALWLIVGVAYAGGRWRSGRERMNFVRFTGELFIYYVLIALGGGVLTGFTMFMFRVIGLDPKWLAQGWLLPCGAMGAVLIGAWLVESKQSVIENMAPVLTRLFTPLFTAVLCAFLATMAWTGSGIDVDRNALIGFDLLLVLVLGLLLYAISARDPQAPPDAFDAMQLLLVVSALVVDAVALTAITARISEFGFSPNKVAALGENLILLVNLAWSAWLYARFLRGRGPFVALERWQTSYLPVYAAWAAIVVVLFPPLFGYV